MTPRAISDPTSYWALALVVARPMPAATVAAVNIGFMEVTQGPIRIDPQTNFRARAGKCGGPDLRGIGVAREIGAYAQPDFKATRNRKSSTQSLPAT
jgi:hypothetical protein